jgi:P27 family predicted phage terminase small subunit
MPAHRKSSTSKHVTRTTRRDRQPRRDFARRLNRAPVPPESLSQGAKAEWERLAPAAVGIGALTAADLRAFELLCVTLATEAEARAVIDREGLTIVAGTGGRKAHPAVRLAETARAQAAQLLTAFGLTPRGRQSIDPPPPPPSPADKFFT